MTTEETELTFVRCPTCRSLVPAVAARCRMCGHQFDAAESDESPDDPGSKKSRVRQRTISASKSEVDGMTERPADAPIRQSEARSTPAESGKSEGETPWLVPRAPREAVAPPAFQGSASEETVEREQRPSGRVPLRFGAEAAAPVRAERWSVQPEVEEAGIVEHELEDTAEFSADDTILSEPESHEDLEPLAVDEENEFDDEGQEFGSAEEQGEELPLGPKKRRRRRRRRRGNTTSLESDSMEQLEDSSGAELQVTESSDEESSEQEISSSNQVEYQRSERQETMNNQRQAPPFHAVPAQTPQAAPIGFASPAREAAPVGQALPAGQAQIVAQQGGTPHRNDVGRGREGNRGPQEPARRGGGPRIEEEGALVGWFVHFTQDPKGSSSELRSGKFFLGRQRLRDGDMVIGDSAISTPHCLVYASPEEGVRIQDLMSEHGTSVKRVGTNSFVPIQDSVALEHGDVLRLGTYEVLVCLVPNR